MDDDAELFNRISLLVGVPVDDRVFRELEQDLGESLTMEKNSQDKVVVYHAEGVAIWCFQNWTVGVLIQLNGILRSGIEETYLSRLQRANLKAFKRTLLKGVRFGDTRAVVIQKLGEPVLSKRYRDLCFTTREKTHQDEDYVDYYELEDLEVRFMFDSKSEQLGWITLGPRDTGAMMEKVMRNS